MSSALRTLLQCVDTPLGQVQSGPWRESRSCGWWGEKPALLGQAALCPRGWSTQASQPGPWPGSGRQHPSSGCPGAAVGRGLGGGEEAQPSALQREREAGLSSPGDFLHKPTLTLSLLGPRGTAEPSPCLPGGHRTGPALGWDAQLLHGVRGQVLERPATSLPWESKNDFFAV